MNIPAVYPKIQFPVSRGTPMISPNIKWDHSEDWCVPSFDPLMNEKSSERKVEISLSEPDFEFIAGHFIDGEINKLLKYVLIIKINEFYLQGDVCSLPPVTYF